MAIGETEIVSGSLFLLLYANKRNVTLIKMNRISGGLPALFFALLLAVLPKGFGQGSPVIASVSPRAAEPGALVQIRGINFLNPRVSVVYFNFTPAIPESIQTIAGGQLINVRVPSGATIGPIIVENSFGQAQTAGNFWVPPVVQRFEKPGAGTGIDRVRGVAGDYVVITGLNFFDSSDAAYRYGVFFDGVRAPIDTVTETSVAVYVPAGAGTGPITVTNNAGAFVTTTNFFVPPTVTGFTPRGRIYDTISITGRSFRAVSSVSFGAITTTDLSVVSGTNLTVVVPPNAPQSGPIAVESPGGRFITISNFVLLPRILSFSPTNGAPGTNVTIAGNGLTGVTTVTFGGVAAAPISVTSTSVVVAVPSGAGSGLLSVVNPLGSDTSTNTFYVRPRITGISPGSLLVGGTLTITGTNFLGATSVVFNTNAVATQFTVLDNRRIEATVPSGAITGRVRVVAPGGEAVSDASLVVIGPDPVIASFSPGSGAVGTVVTITGNNLSPATSVKFGTVAATTVTTIPTGLTATVPAGATTGRITVQTAQGTAVSATDFVVGNTASVSVNMTSSETSTVIGAEVRLSLTVRNTGPLSASGTTAAITLPQSVEFLGVTPSGGTFNRTASGIDFGIGAIPVNSTWTAQVRLRFPAAATAAFTFSATSATPDPDTGDNSTQLSLEATPLRLDFSSFGDDLLILSWPSGASNVVLQQTISLSPLQWQPVTNVPSDDGSRLQVELNPTNSSRLFRLRGP